MQLSTCFITSFKIVFISMFFTINSFQLAVAQESATNGNDQKNSSMEQFAQASESSQFPSESLRSEPISITATRNPMKAFEYPGMVSVIDKEEINLNSPSTVDDVLKWVPNVEFTGGPRRTGQELNIRGFSGADVVVTVDGARQNFGSAHDGRFFIDPSLLRGVEVLRGSSSSLYGSGGNGGVLSFRTVEAGDYLAPGQKAGVSVNTGFQAVNGETFATFQLFGNPIEEVDFLTAVTKRGSGPIRLGDGSEVLNTDDDILSMLAKASWDFRPFHSVEASFQRFSNDAREPNNGQGAGGTNLTDKEIVTDNYRISYKYNNPANKMVNFDATVYLTQFQVDELRLDSNSGTAGELLKRDLDTLGFRMENRSKFAAGGEDSITFTYGSEGYNEAQDGAIDNGNRGGVPDAEANFFGVFAQAEYSLNNPLGLPGNFLVIPGIRYDHFATSNSTNKDVLDDAVSPRIAVSYFPTDWSMLFTSYGEAFRAPTLNEVFADGNHFGFNNFVPNPNLRSQQTDTLEFGVGFDFENVIWGKDKFKVKASHFRTEAVDLITTEVRGGFFGTTVIENTADARLWGTEIEANYENHRVRLIFGYSVVDGIDKSDGSRTGSLTPGQLTLDSGLKLPEINSLLGWRIFSAAQFDRKATATDNERRGYVEHNFYYNWRPGGALKGLAVNLGVNNAFDQNYSRINTDALDPGRNVKGSVSYTLTF